MTKIRRFFLLTLLLLSSSSCVSAYRQSIGADTTKTFSRIYFTDFNVAWQSALDALKASPLDVSNREGGFIQTRWIDNTSEKNFSDSFGSAKSYLKAQYRLKLSVAKGFYNGRPTIKITTLKEQLVQNDVLDGWRAKETDGIDENTILYRVGRIIYIKMKIAKLEEEKTRKSLEDVKF